MEGGYYTSITLKVGIHDLQNYRGISLLCVLGKLLTKALNTRFQTRADNNDINKNKQAGYRKGLLKIDYSFIFYAVVSKYIFKKKGRLYVCFVDFSKAFGSIGLRRILYFGIK